MQITPIKLIVGKLLLIVYLLLLNSLLLLNKLKASIITIKKIKSYKKSFIAPLAKGKIKIKIYLLLIKKL
jgi:hypothetical protein